MDWYLAVLKKYAVFSGRARRKEYWMFTFVSAIISFALSLPAYLNVDERVLTAVVWLAGLYSLAIVLPSLAVTVRRLHDTNHSGWSMFIAFVPFVGGIILLVWLATESDAGENRYGPNPKAVSPMGRPALTA